MKLALRSIFALAVVLSSAPHAHADPHPLSGVGRLASADKPPCSAVLIAPDLVLTAAHCANLVTTTYTFHSAAYPGTPGRSRTVAAVAPHPVFMLGLGSRLSRLRVDVALMRVDPPFPPEEVSAIPVGAPARAGSSYQVASFIGGVGIRPRERPCEAFSESQELVSLGGVVQGGESGAPVLRRTPQGVEVAAVLTARTRAGQQPIGLAVAVERHLETLKSALKNAEQTASGEGG